MSRRLGSWWVVLSALVAACAAQGRLARYQAMSAEAQATYDKYQQFFTEGQRDAYLGLPTDEERQRFLSDLHIEDRIGRYPKYIQDAIWSRQVVPGMDKQALFLTWGQPDEIDRAGYEASRGVEREVWFFRRGTSHKDDYQVLVVNGEVVEVQLPTK